MENAVPNASAIPILEIISIVSSVVSVIIGGFAIWLSVTFYKLSNKITEDTKEAAKGISASVDRLESLFDRLYSDTFTMMKDTVSDMRKHIWPDKEQSNEALAKIEEKADEKIQNVRTEISKELSVMMSQLGRTDHKIHGIEGRLSELIDRAIQKTRRVESEAQEEMSVSSVMNILLRLLNRYGEMPLMRLLDHPTIRRAYPRAMVLESVDILRREDMIEIDGAIGDLKTIVRSKVPHQKHRPSDDKQK